MKEMADFSKSALMLTFDHLEEVHTFLNVCSIFAVHESAPEILRKSTMSYLNNRINLESIAEELERKDYKKSVKMHELGEELLLRDVYTMISEYCRINKYDQELLDQPWRNFARIIRNYVTHGILNPTCYTNVSFPVKWKNNIITKDNVDKSNIDLKRQFSPGYQLELFNEIKRFAETLS